MEKVIAIKNHHQITGDSPEDAMLKFVNSYGYDPDYILTYSEVRNSESRKKNAILKLKAQGKI